MEMIPLIKTVIVIQILSKGEKDWNTFQACKMLMMDILTCLFKNVVHFTTVLKCSF